MASPEPQGREAAVTVAARRPVSLARAVSAPGVVSIQGGTPARRVVPLDRVQEALPGPLRRIPVQVILAAGGLAVVSILVPAMVLLRSDRAVPALEEDGPLPSTSARTSPPPGAATSSARPPARLTAAELEAARASGTDALVVLARRFPDDPGVLQALGTALARDRKDPAGALKALRRLLEVAPDTRGDREVQQALVDLANGTPDVAAEVFELLRTRMGSVGPDIVFDLSQSATGKYAKEHAAAALDDPVLMKSATQPLLVASELRRLMPCSRKPVVARAAAQGDARSVPSLRQMISTKPCTGITALLRGPDCPAYPCFNAQEKTAITAAIAAIEKRDGGKPGDAPTATPARPAPTAPAPTALPGGGAGLGH